MIRHKYGEFAPIQFDEYKRQLHSSIHWLLIYRDPETSSQWKDINVDQYLYYLLRKIGGLNSLFGHPASIVTLLTVLQAAKDENEKVNFDWHVFRKLVLDAQAIVDTLPCDDKGGGTDV